MGMILDLIIIIFILICTYFGYKKGLIGVAFKILSFFIAIGIALLLYKPISNFVINNTEIDNNIENVIVQNLVKNGYDENIIKINQNNDVPEIVNNYINKIASNTTTSIASAVGASLSITIVNLGVMLILFIGTKIILIFAKALSGAIAKIPVIKQFNKLGGIIYGIIQSIVLLYVFFAIISFISPMIIDFKLIEIINKSFIGSILYNDNLLIKILFV